MNTIRLRYFITAAKYKSFSEAAKQLYTTQPNISKQIANMERELGVQLFVRTQRGLNLTRAGQYIYDELADVSDKIDGTFSRARELADNEVNTVTIGSPFYPRLSEAINTVIRRFCREEDNTLYEFEFGGYAQLRQGLASGQYDLVILTAFELPQISCPFEYERIMSIPAAIAVRADHPLADRKNLSLSDFKDCDFVATSPDESSVNYAGFIELCNERGFTPRITRTVKTLDSLLLCVEAGLGVCLVDMDVPVGKNSDMKLIPITDNISSDIVAVWRSDSESRILKTVITAIKKELHLT